MRLKGVSCGKKTLEDYSIKYAKLIIANSGRADDNHRYCQVFKF